jgi:hypothetical protein
MEAHMTTEYLNRRISLLPDDPQNVRLIPCSSCGISTNHHRTESGLWVCWCGNVDQPGPTVAERQDAIDYEIAQDRAEWTDGLWEEIAENIIKLDGSDTSVQTQLFDAGYDGGIY